MISFILKLIRRITLLFLTDEEIQQKYSMQDAVHDVRQVLIDLNNNKIKTKDRTVITLNDNNSMLYMPCVNTESNYSIIKTISIFPNNKEKPVSQGVTLITELETGQHVANLESSYLTRLRTGAMSAIATDKLSNKNAHTLAVIGTGGMAFEQVLGILEVRDIKTINLYKKKKKKAEIFKRKLLNFGVSAKINVCNSSGESVQSADIVNCATKSDANVFNHKDLKEEVHINGVGSYLPDMREIDIETINKANTIVFDDIEGEREEAGEFIQAVKLKKFELGGVNVISLNDIHSTDKSNGITIFKSVGAAYYDLAVTVGVYNKFRK